MESANFLSEMSKFALRKTSVHTSSPSATMNLNLGSRPTLMVAPPNLERNEIRSLIANHDLATLRHVLQGKYTFKP